MNSVGMQGAHEGDLSLEHEMWLLLILGGIEVRVSRLLAAQRDSPLMKGIRYAAAVSPNGITGFRIFVT